MSKFSISEYPVDALLIVRHYLLIYNELLPRQIVELSGVSYRAVTLSVKKLLESGQLERRYHLDRCMRDTYYRLTEFGITLAVKSILEIERVLKCLA